MKRQTADIVWVWVVILFMTIAPVVSLHGQHKPFVVVLDAGHGGNDPGNTKNSYKEKNIALAITLAVGRELEKNKDIKVVYTRKTDVFIGLKERAAIANKAQADLFVSVHCNAHSSNAHGTETFVLGLHKSEANLEIAKKENQVIYLEDNYEEKYEGFDPNSPQSLIGLTLMQEEYLDQSIEMASNIQDNFTRDLKRNNRSVKQAGFWVLHNTYMPSVLIETGFLSNKNEGAYLNSKKGQGEMARAIAKAVKRYHKNFTARTPEATEITVSALDINQHLNDQEPDIYENITFKVQLLASSQMKKTNPGNFNGLDQITVIEEGGLYKYFYGSTSDYNKIRIMQTLARQRGYTHAFVVAYAKDGKRLHLLDVLK